MSLEIVPYTAELEPKWDEFCVGSVNGTLLHTRRFLSYHGTRFDDHSILLVDGGETVGVFPAASKPGDKSSVSSHVGATFGGIVHQGWLTGSRTIEAIELLRRHYAGAGFKKLVYKTVPSIYQKSPAQDESYALFRLGARRAQCNLACAIDLDHRLPPSERRRRGLKKALKSVTLSDDPAHLEPLWGVLEQNLSQKHGAQPVHSAEELRLIQGRFPEQVLVRSALVEGKVEAGVVFFNAPKAWHCQYIASSEKGYDLSALDAVFDAAIAESKQKGARYFDFGTSNEEGGQVLNEGLYRFKSEFGGGGVAYEIFELDL